jgi:hypothetical protein
MQLVINTSGAYLKKSGKCFVIKNQDKVFEVSPSIITRIETSYKYALLRSNNVFLLLRLATKTPAVYALILPY